MRQSLAVLATAAILAVGTAQAESASYAIDPSHTYVTFEIGHFGTSTNRGRFDRKEGTVQFDRTSKSGKVDVSIDVASINSGFEAFNKHLQSPDLFDAAKYPKIRFFADQFAFSGDNVSEIAGTLTLLGKTLPVTLKANQFNCYQNRMNKREVCGGDFETTIDRSQWGMNYGIDWGFPKNVRLLVQVEAIKQ
ncbi:MAG: YceI family protein [Betaproteobacteria bacterium]